MGCFSWMFCDKQNKKPLNMGMAGNIICPDGMFIHTEVYEGYGCFGSRDDVDVYDLVADWNRQFLIEHPDYEIPQFTRSWNEEFKDWLYDPPKKVSEFQWWPAYSDLNMSHKDIENYMRQEKGNQFWEYRYIGIDIACYDAQNEILPYPIKIVSETYRKRFEKPGKATPEHYKELPASEGDPNQGFGRNL